MMCSVISVRIQTADDKGSTSSTLFVNSEFVQDYFHQAMPLSNGDDNNYGFSSNDPSSVYTFPHVIEDGDTTTTIGEYVIPGAIEQHGHLDASQYSDIGACYTSPVNENELYHAYADGSSESTAVYEVPLNNHPAAHHQLCETSQAAYDVAGNDTVYNKAGATIKEVVYDVAEDLKEAYGFGVYDLRTIPQCQTLEDDVTYCIAISGSDEALRDIQA